MDAAPGLFCPMCPAFSICGGDTSAPCGCVPSLLATRPCPACRVMCRERGVGYGYARDAAAHQELFGSGLSLDALALRGPHVPALPRVILLETNQLPVGHGLELDWAGVRLERLVSRRPGLRTRARVPETTRLVAVLNSADRFLETLWGWQPEGRARFTAWLREEGAEVLTGPTFSVHETRPAIDRITALHRHHRVCAEASRRGLAVAPNVYWANERYRAAWSRWFVEHPEVTTVSRDMTMTKMPAVQAQYRALLLDALDPCDRAFHFLLTGVGGKTAAGWAADLAERGHSFTLLATEPIVSTRMSGRRLVAHNGLLESVADQTDKDDLCVENVRTFVGYVSSLR